ASMDHISANYDLAIYYSKNEDFKSSLEFFKKAAELGDFESQLKLGYYFDNGVKGAKKDCKEAVKWAKKAASQQDVRGKTLLGHIYLNNNELKDNLVNAYAWYHLASLQKIEDDETVKYIEYNLDKLSKKLTEEQVNQAKNYAQESAKTSSD
ncbi:MAG: sel1 repeat family protein, partial [Proteobacteria bacterium]|nr:sel1 repeat family protein [Pseudomonadota bacterium]